MRTTVNIDDSLLEAAKTAARERGYTLGGLFEAALRRELAEPTTKEAPPIPVFTRGTGVRPGVDLRSNRAIAELLDSLEQDPER